MNTPRHSRHRKHHSPIRARRNSWKGDEQAAYEAQIAHDARIAFETHLREADGAAPMPVARRRAKKPGKRPLWVKIRRFGLLLLPLGLFELGAACLTSPHFAVKGVDLVGLHATDADLLRPIALSLIDQNWLRADLQSAAREASKIPTVREAKIVRQWSAWPPRLALRIEERAPFARIGDATEWVVDRDGVPFRCADAGDSSLVALTLSLAETESLRAGKALPAAVWQPARVLLEALAADEEKGAHWSLKRVYLDRRGFASLRLRGGAKDGLLVRLGDDQWPRKLARARQSLAFFAATGKRAQALDLVSYTMPTWTPLAAPQASSTPRASKENSGVPTPPAAPVTSGYSIQKPA